MPSHWSHSQWEEREPMVYYPLHLSPFRFCHGVSFYGTLTKSLNVDHFDIASHSSHCQWEDGWNIWCLISFILPHFDSVHFGSLYDTLRKLVIKCDPHWSQKREELGTLSKPLILCILLKSDSVSGDH